MAHVHHTYLNLTENWIYHQIRFLQNFRSIFLAKRAANREQFPWDDVHLLSDRSRARRELNRLARHVVGYYPFYRAVCRAESVAVLHAHSGILGLRTLRLAEVLRVPLVTSFYGYELTVSKRGEQELHRRYRPLFQRGAVCIAEGPAARERLLELGCSPEKTWIHRLGVDLTEIPLVERRPHAEGRMRILMAARFDEKKGLPFGMEAFCRVALHRPEMELTVVGDADPSAAQQAIRERLHRLVAEAGLGERVRFLGFVPARGLRTLLREHHVLLHPSVRASNGDTEGGHPVILTEAAASGMPIISTWHCDIPEVVVDGSTGWLCPERSVEDLVAALDRAWASRDQFPAMGRRARALVEAKYDGRRNTLDAVYARVLGNG